MSALVECRIIQAVDLLKSLVSEVRNLRHEVSKLNTTRGQHEQGTMAHDPANHLRHGDSSTTNAGSINTVRTPEDRATNPGSESALCAHDTPQTGAPERRAQEAIKAAMSFGGIVYAEPNPALDEIRVEIQRWQTLATTEENVGGNVVKAATYRGTETGLIIAEQIILEHSSNPTKGVSKP
jgi:hypothetical protein